MLDAFEGRLSTDEPGLVRAEPPAQIPSAPEEKARLVLRLLESEILILADESTPTPAFAEVLRLASLAGVRRALLVSRERPSGDELATLCRELSMVIRQATLDDLSPEPILEWIGQPDAKATSEAADHFAANLFWFSKDPLPRGREYLIHLGKSSVFGSVARLQHRIDTGEPLALSDLKQGQAAEVNLVLREAVVVPRSPTRLEESFVITDLSSPTILGAGFLRRELFRATAVQWQPTGVTPKDRAAGQRPTIVWFTGLPGSGKTTLANVLEADLFRRGARTLVIDADNIRKGLNKDLGFSDADRVENIRRLAEVAKIVSDAGVLPIVASISPFQAERQAARRIFSEHTFVEVFVDAPIEICVARDPKGLYRMQALGQIQRMTGINSPYEPPTSPEMHLRTDQMDLEECLGAMLACLRKTGLLLGR